MHCILSEGIVALSACAGLKLLAKVQKEEQPAQVVSGDIRLPPHTGAMKQRIQSSHIPLCHRHMVIATTLSVHCFSHRIQGGRISSGDKFGGETFMKEISKKNFDKPPILVQGHQTQETSTPPTPNPWFLVDNQSCETLAGQNFEIFQKKRGRPRLALHTDEWT